MRTLGTFLIETLWLAGAALFAYYFLYTFLGIEAVAAATTYGIKKVEETWQ